jgi:hypothetical protein
MTPYNVAVQVFSRTGPELAFLEEDRAALRQELGEDFDLGFLPPVVRSHRPDVAYANLETTIVLIFLGIGFSSIAKPFFQAAATEAGKDFWTAAKKLAAKLWQRQADRAYALTGDVVLMLELRDEHVAIRLHLNSRSAGEDPMTSIETQLKQLADDWDQVNQLLTRFQVGRVSRNLSESTDGAFHVHLIAKRDGRWDVRPIKASSFPAEDSIGGGFGLE